MLESYTLVYSGKMLISAKEEGSQYEAVLHSYRKSLTHHQNLVQSNS